MAKPYTHLLESRKFTSPVSELSGGGATVTLNLDPSYRHWFAGLLFLKAGTSPGADVPEGFEPVQPTAGTAVFTVGSLVQPTFFQDFTGNSISVDTVDQVSWASNVTSVKATISGVTGEATHVQVITVGNIS